MKMILHQDITMHFHPVALLLPFSEIAQKLSSISARHDVVDGIGKLNPKEVVTPFSVITLKS
jgi:hypothetical protein